MNNEFDFAIKGTIKSVSPLIYADGDRYEYDHRKIRVKSDDDELYYVIVIPNPGITVPLLEQNVVIRGKIVPTMSDNILVGHQIIINYDLFTLNRNLYENGNMGNIQK
jgi:hypothetical protein